MGSNDTSAPERKLASSGSGVQGIYRMIVLLWHRHPVAGKMCAAPYRRSTWWYKNFRVLISWSSHHRESIFTAKVSRSTVVCTNVVYYHVVIIECEQLVNKGRNKWRLLFLIECDSCGS